MHEFLAMMWVAMALYVFFETSAVYEYLKVLRIPNFISRIRSYESHRADLESTGMGSLIPSYGNYMRQNHDCFLVRWATCPYCLGVLLSVAATLTFSKWQMIPITYLGGILSYRLFTGAVGWLQRRSDG